MDLDMNTIGQRIKKRRLDLDLKQTTIKDAVGISSGNLSEIENGNRTPSMATLYRLSEILDCSIDWIVKGESPIKENFAFSYKEEREQLLLKYYTSVSQSDQEELLMLAKMKYDKAKVMIQENEGRMKTSSPLQNGNTDIEIA